MCRLRENLIVLGGRNRQSFVKSVYLLDLCTLVWSQIRLMDNAMHTARLAVERSEFSTAGSRQENKIYIFGGIDSTFCLTNEVLVLKFDQLAINPLLEDSYHRQANISSEREVNLQFFK